MTFLFFEDSLSPDPLHPIIDRQDVLEKLKVGLLVDEDRLHLDYMN